MQGVKVLITGGAGFLGSNLAHRLAAAGAELVLADNLSRRGVELNQREFQEAYPGTAFYTVEVNDVPALIARERPALIYHFAAQVAVTMSVQSPVSDFHINAEGTFNVARTAGEYDIPVVYASTNKVYGDNVNRVPVVELPMRYEFAGGLGGRGVDEAFSIDAAHHTPYGCSKLVGELYVREWGGVVNRFSCMYGPRQHGMIDQGWLSYFIAQKLAGKPVTIFGDGKQVRDVLHVRDVVELLVRQGEHLLDPAKQSIRGEVYSIGGGYANTLSLLELCYILNITPQFGPWRPSDQKVFYADIRKARETFGWEPRVSYRTGIEELSAWTTSLLAASLPRTVSVPA